jgi:hypothetical protein
MTFDVGPTNMKRLLCTFHRFWPRLAAQANSSMVLRHPDYPFYGHTRRAEHLVNGDYGVISGAGLPVL